MTLLSEIVSLYALDSILVGSALSCFINDYFVYFEKMVCYFAFVAKYNLLQEKTNGTEENEYNVDAIFVYICISK